MTNKPLTKVFIVSTIFDTQTIEIGGIHRHELKLTWHEDMIGVFPIFKSKKAAQKCYPDTEIIEGELCLIPSDNKTLPK